MSNSTSSAVVIHHSNPAHGHQAPTDVIVDALPYYDSGYDEPGARETVRRSNSFPDVFHQSCSRQ